MLTFSPAPTEIDDVLAVLGDPARSLVEIASAFRTTVRALKEWLATPEIAARLQSIEDFCLQRTRLLVATALPNVVRAVARIVQDFNSEQQQMEQHSTGEQLNENRQVADPKSATNRRASRQAVLNAARLLLQLSSLTRDSRETKAARVRTIPTPEPHAAGMQLHRAAGSSISRAT